MLRENRCCLIGNGSLLIQCGNKLIESGYDIKCIVTSDEDITEWAEQNSIYTCHYNDNFSEKITLLDYDYLFSIANLKVLPENIIDSPKVMAINYHDAPLPRYAGLNATSWAIINGEKKHGITWHEMVAKVDEGRIVKQRVFDLDEEETAFSLNLKCYYEAYDAFCELVDDLSSGCINKVNQNLNKRSYVGKYKRPDNLGFINWDSSAEKIDCLIRGLDFSNYENPLASVKIAIGKSIFIVTNCKNTFKKSQFAPGHIIQIENGFLTISTSTYDINLVNLVNLNGSPLSNDDLDKCKEFIGKKIKNGYEIITDKLRDEYESTILRNESYWVKTLNLFTHKDEPMSSKTGHVEQSCDMSKVVVEWLNSNFTDEKRMEAIYAMLYLYVVSQIPAYAGSIGIELGGMAVEEAAELFLKVVPFQSSKNPGAACKYDDFEYVRNEISQISDKGRCQTDLFFRYKNLNGNQVSGNEFLSDITFSPTTSELSKAENRETKFIKIDLCNRKWTAYGKKDFVIGVDKNLNEFIENIIIKNGCGEMSNKKEAIDEVSQSSFNNTHVDYDYKKTVCERIYDQALITPNNIAVRCGDNEITYSELIDKSLILAKKLVENGAGNGVKIGILTSRSIEMVISLIGVMRTGSTYIPLDSIYPEDRIDHMVSDSGLSMLITDSDEYNNYSKSCSIVNVRDVLKGANELGDLDLAYPEQDDILYIIYTSGSTGKPKGVEIYQKGLTNFLLSMQKEPGLSDADTLLSVTTICFDIATLEIFLPLISGATTEIASAEMIKDGIALLERLEKGDITVMQATPTTWEMLLIAGWDAKINIKALCGGEALREELARKLIPLTNDLWNMYGPTETTVWSSIKKIVTEKNITVGSPIDNTQMFIMNDDGTINFHGEKGELCIGGDGLAKGYYNRESLTFERFVECDIPGSGVRRLYKTGDVASISNDGEVLCHGRIDNQIKLNGYRIEIGEIESVIDTIGFVSKSIVIVDDKNEDKYLHAYLILSSKDQDAYETSIKHSLSSKLPHYMIPTKYSIVSEFPLTQNGKVDRNKLKALHTDSEKVTSTKSDDKEKIIGNLVANLKSIASSIIGEQDIPSDVHLGEIGFNSLKFTQLSVKIKKELSVKVSPAIFYTYSTIEKIATHIADKHIENFVEIIPQKNVAHDNSNASARLDDVVAKNKVEDISVKKKVAIVGMSLRLPGSKNIHEFWNNLENKVDCVSEIPKQRWDWKNVAYSNGKENPYKWGGFIEDVGSFDTEFFNISPREAILMDPQQRLVMESVWSALENGGIDPESLSNSRTGVYIGVVTSDYWDLMNRNGIQPDGYSISGNINCVIANRVSYYLNLKGPSSVIDTACSSSLVALHRACRAIQSNECESAIVSGVNVIASPYIHHSFSMNGMLSKDGRCKSFDKDANGYVRSEGVVTLVLKPLDTAVRDNDHIYGVVLGSYENHGGRTNSLSAPNGEAQSELISSSIEDAGIDPSTITYIEAHGSGTSLGDPIEIDGIKNAFENSKQSTEFTGCGIGSVKSNIGHLEAVAGLAGVAKVLISMEKQVMPGMAQFNEQNPYIDISDTQFRFVHDNEPWQRTRLQSGVVPRIASVSSFGFGGVNANVIIEEYERENRIQKRSPLDKIFVLTAKSQEALKRYVSVIKNHLLEGNYSEDNDYLGSLAYTLQVGRTHFNYRIAIEYTDGLDLIEKLNNYDSIGVSEGILEGNVNENKSIYNNYFSGLDEEEIVRSLDKKGDATKLASLWILGMPVKWLELYAGLSYEKVPLPTYPFNRNHYWIDVHDSQGKLAELESHRLSNGLIDSVINHDDAKRYIKSAKASNPFIGDHVVNHQVVFPAVAYTEMARAAGEMFKNGKRVGALKSNVWMYPLIIDVENEVYVDIEESPSGCQYKIKSLNKTGEILHAQGVIEFQEAPQQNIFVDFDKISKKCHSTLQREEVYRLFDKLEFQYKDTYKPIEWISYGDNIAISKVVIPEISRSENNNFVLNPAVLEGSIQSVIGSIASEEAQNLVPYMPFSLRNLLIHSPLTHEVMVYVERVGAKTISDKSLRKFNIKICDLESRVLVELNEYVLKNRELTSRDDESNIYAFKREWVSTDVDNIGNVSIGKTLFITNVFGVKDKVSSSTGGDVGIEYVDAVVGSTGNAGSQHLLNMTDTTQIRKVLNNIKNSGNFPENIVLYVRGMESVDVVSEVQSSYGVFLRLIKAILNEIGSEKVNVVYAYDATGNGNDIYSSSISSVVKTVNIESTKVKAKCVGVSGSDEEKAGQILSEIKYFENGSVVRYLSGERYINRYLKAPALDVKERKVFRNNGVYVITGGFGSIGKVIIKSAINKYCKKIIIIGRRTVDNLTSEERHLLEGSAIEYISVDLTDRVSTESVLNEIIRIHGEITGLVHCAGVLNDSIIAKLNVDDIDEVITSKSISAINIADSIRNKKVEFVLLFSSVSSAFGNVGQANYCYANALLDELADRENSNIGNTQYVAVNWPLWIDGGMTPDTNSIKAFSNTTGIQPITSKQGLSILNRVFSIGGSVVLFSPGNAEKIENMLLVRSGISINKNDSNVGSREDIMGINKDTVAYKKVNPQAENKPMSLDDLVSDIVGFASNTLMISEENIDPEAALSSYGFDSISNTELSSKINTAYNIDTTPVIFFEYGTINEIASYLYSEYERKFSVVKKKIDSIPGIDKTVDVDDVTKNGHEETFLAELVRDLSILLKINIENIDVDKDLSDYGMDSITNTEFSTLLNKQYGLDTTPVLFFEYANLRSISEYILAEYGDKIRRNTDNQNLSKATEIIIDAVSSNDSVITNRSLLASCQDEIDPKNNDMAIIGLSGIMPGSDGLDAFWDNLCAGRNLISASPTDRSRSDTLTTIKYGAFCNNIAEFSPEFFGMTASEALLMDPQQRLMLLLVWRAMQDSGYTKSSFSGTKTGLFVGVSNRDYFYYLQDQGVEISPDVSFGNNNTFLANRISHIYNLKGPSEPVDTLCSSSLVALHRAIQSIKYGESDCAIVGGINVIAHDQLTSVFEQAGMLSKSGQCYSFDERGDGFVRGEGGGVVIIKKLTDAVRDGDNVHAVIKGSAVNHGGKSNGITAPNVNSQASLIIDAYRNSNISPSRVSYIESHGVGSKLGDAIEINALSKAFKSISGGNELPKKSIAIGSVKSNIGHLEAASGMASLIKVILSLKHKVLPKLSNFSSLNKYISLDDSEFYLVNENTKWKTSSPNLNTSMPIVSGISSFGAGGVNAHIVLEEFSRKTNEFDANNEDDEFWLLLSSFDGVLIKEYAIELLSYMENCDEPNNNLLSDIIYTLKVGRDNLPYRIAIKCFDFESAKSSLALLISQLEENGKYSDEHVYPGAVSDWLSGNDVDWESEYASLNNKKVSLPYSKIPMKSYWYSDKKVLDAMPIDIPSTDAIVSVKYNEPFLKDHLVFDEQVFLGVGYASIIDLAVRDAYKSQSFYSIANLRFITPLSLHKGEDAAIYVEKYSDGDVINVDVGFRLSSEDGDNLAAKAQVIKYEKHRPSRIDIKEISSRAMKVSNGGEVYNLLQMQGVSYNASLLTVKKILIGDDSSIAKIIIDTDYKIGGIGFNLNPLLLDAAVVSSKYTFIRDHDLTYIPFMIKNITQFEAITAGEYYCYNQHVKSNDQVVISDSTICDKYGNILMIVEGIVCKRVWSETDFKGQLEKIKQNN